jgi:hypothetical protein
LEGGAREDEKGDDEMNEWKKNFEDSQKLVEGLKEMGLSDLASERMERLLSFRSTPEEKERWIELGILDPKGNKLLLGEDVNEDNFTIEVILWEGVYEGIFIKTSGGYQRTGKDNARYE